MTLFEESFLILLDKLIIGLIILGASYWIKKELEKFRFNKERIKELENQQRDIEKSLFLDKRERELVFIDKQIKQFFWPIHLKLEKDTSLWKMVGVLYKSKDSLPIEANEYFENRFILKNHEEIVQIIENNIYLIKDDKKLLESLIAYIKHVAVYVTLRNTKEIKHLNPIDLKEPFPQELPKLIKERLEKLIIVYREIKDESKNLQ